MRIRLNVRGICCLRPGVKGVSETIEVVSIVDRFLEHARIFHFRNGGDEEVYLASADWMPRNLDRRIELLFPVESPDCRSKVHGRPRRDVPGQRQGAAAAAGRHLQAQDGRARARSPSARRSGCTRTRCAASRRRPRRRGWCWSRSRRRSRRPEAVGRYRLGARLLGGVVHALAVAQGEPFVAGLGRLLVVAPTLDDVGGAALALQPAREALRLGLLRVFRHLYLFSRSRRKDGRPE